jgi:hypothetical protein
MGDEELLRPSSTATTSDLSDDPILESLVRERSQDPLRPIAVRKQEWDPAFDLRVARPRAIDLLKFWKLTGQPVPPEIAASLGPRRPILLSHVVTPFPSDGRAPGGVWGLGYELTVNDAEANTVSVVPNDEVVRVGVVGQKTELGLNLGGGLQVPEATWKAAGGAPSVSLTGAEVTASTNWTFQFSVKLEITFRKVIGAPVDAGGAKWQLFRQDEPLDRPHALLQTLLVDRATPSIACTVKSWAKQAGWLGTSFGAKLWHYPDADFVVSL